MSSIELAPAANPATNAATSTGALRPPVFSAVSFAATGSAKPHRTAGATTGARPAQNTRLGSSIATDNAGDT